MTRQFHETSQAAAVWGTLGGTIIATALTVYAVFRDRFARPDTTSEFDVLVTLTALIVAFRFFLRTLFMFSDNDRRIAFSRCSQQAQGALAYTHLLLVAFCCINVAVLRILGIIAASVVILVQSVCALFAWFIMFHPLFFDTAQFPPDLARRRKFLGRHAWTLIIDIVLAILAYTLVTASLLAPNDARPDAAGLALGIVMFATAIEIALHTPATAFPKSLRI